jgi:hypothetical protein
MFLCIEICGARALAHEEMRKRYPRFDEFLYAAVAPNRTLVSDDILSASWLVWLEGGCNEAGSAVQTSQTDGSGRKPTSPGRIRAPSRDFSG